MRMEELFSELQSEVEECVASTEYDGAKPYRELNDLDEFYEIQPKKCSDFITEDSITIGKLLGNVQKYRENENTQNKMTPGLLKRKLGAPVLFEDDANTFTENHMGEKKPSEKSKKLILGEIQRNKKMKDDFYITPTQIIKLMTKRAQKSFSLFDCRDLSEFKKGHINDSICFKGAPELYNICKHKQMAILYSDESEDGDSSTTSPERISKAVSVYQKMKDCNPKIKFYVLKGGYSAFLNDYPFFCKLQ